MFLKNIMFKRIKGLQITLTNKKQFVKILTVKKSFGDDSYVEIPLPIPNREVKHVHVEDSAEQK